MVRTFYDVLGVSPSATIEEIDAAYRERLKDTHPDVSDEETASETVKAVIEAGDVLTDEAERDRYDRLGHERYVAITDVYDPVDESQSGAGSGTKRRPSTDASAVGEYSTAGSTRGTASDDDTPRASTTEPTGNRSTSAGDVHTANANPEGVNWASPEADDDVREATREAYTASTSERSILFLAALVAYPILVFASLYPEFLLPFRAIIAACGLALVVYLVSVPVVSVPAFGILTVVAGGVMFVTGTPALSVLSVGAMVVTAVPFALAVFVYTLKL